jgi:hypothetical protein
MLRRYLWFVALGAGVKSFAPAAAQEGNGLDVTAFLKSWESMVGQHVTLSGCKPAGFLSDAVGCYPQAGSGKVAVDARTLDRGSLRLMLKNCVGRSPASECRVSVTGQVATGAFHAPRLDGAVVSWRIEADH